MDNICERCKLNFEEARHGVKLVGFTIYCDNCGCEVVEKEIPCYYVSEKGNEIHTIHYFERYTQKRCDGCGGMQLGINVYCGGIDISNEIKAFVEIKNDNSPPDNNRSI